MEDNMPWTDEHLAWLTDSGEVINTACGSQAKVLNFNYDLNNDEVMTAWAKHLRNHYCEDIDIDEDLDGTGYTRKEFLLKLKFPAEKVTGDHERSGPATRSGDFTEILVSDYLEYILNYYVPRTRYAYKVNPNMSENGSDTFGFKISPDGNSRQDELTIFEVKARLTGTRPVNQLQTAVDDSSKDSVRFSETLNAAKQRLKLRGDRAGVNTVKRFQNPTDNPYIYTSGAATVLVDGMYSINELSKTDTSNHSNNTNLKLLVIKGGELMDLVHKLYEVAANEA